MIGKKSLAQIRVSLSEDCLQAAIDPVELIGKLLSKFDSKPAANHREIETLELIRDGLRSRASKASRSRKEKRPNKIVN